MFALKHVNEDTAMKRMGVEDFKGKENRGWREREGGESKGGKVNDEHIGRKWC